MYHIIDTHGGNVEESILMNEHISSFDFVLQDIEESDEIIFIDRY